MSTCVTNLQIHDPCNTLHTWQTHVPPLHITHLTDPCSPSAHYTPDRPLFALCTLHTWQTHFTPCTLHTWQTPVRPLHITHVTDPFYPILHLTYLTYLCSPSAHYIPDRPVFPPAHYTPYRPMFPLCTLHTLQTHVPPLHITHLADPCSPPVHYIPGRPLCILHIYRLLFQCFFWYEWGLWVNIPFVYAWNLCLYRPDVSIFLIPRRQDTFQSNRKLTIAYLFLADGLPSNML